MSVKFVAEVSSNHNRDFDRSLKFIDAAKEVGCDAVKFQLFKLDELFAPEVIAKKPELQARRQWELPLEYIPKLASRAHSLGMEFSCTPFYLEAVRELLPYVDFYKIASYEILWTDLLVRCAQTGKPVVISTGMADTTEIVGAVTTLKNAGAKDVTVLHCTSAYPTPLHEANVGAISSLERLLQPFQDDMELKFGLSDHTVSEAAILKSVFSHNSKFIEFHFDLDGQGEEFGPGHCWLPEQIKRVIKLSREGAIAEGSGIKKPSPSELSDRLWRADPSDGLRPLLETRHQFQ